MIKQAHVLFSVLLGASFLVPLANSEELTNADLRLLFPPTIAPAEGQPTPPAPTEVPYCDLFRIPKKVADYGQYFQNAASVNDASWQVAWQGTTNVTGPVPDAILYDADQRSVLYVYLKHEGVAKYVGPESFQMLPTVSSIPQSAASHEAIASSIDSAADVHARLVRSAEKVCRKMARCECIKGGSTPATAAALIATEQSVKLDVVVNAAVESVFKRYGNDMLSEAQKSQLRAQILSELETDNTEVADRIKDVVSTFLAAQRATISKEVAESIANQPEFRVFIQRELRRLVRNPPRRNN